MDPERHASFGSMDRSNLARSRARHGLCELMVVGEIRGRGHNVTKRCASSSRVTAWPYSGRDVTRHLSAAYSSAPLRPGLPAALMYPGFARPTDLGGISARLALISPRTARAAANLR